MININDMSRIYELQDKLSVSQWEAVKEVFEVFLSNNQPEQAQSLIDGMLGLARYEAVKGCHQFNSVQFRDDYFDHFPERLVNGLLATVRVSENRVKFYKWCSGMGLQASHWKLVGSGVL